MPFKHKNIEYGLPHEEYPKENVDQYMEELKKVIGLEKEPVAITFLFKKEDYDEYPIEEIKAAMPYCVMVKQAALQGKGIKSRLEHHKCDGATTALALEPSTEKIESGQEYFSYKLYSSVATARRLRSSIKSLHRMPVHNYGVAIVPLSQCVQTPDVIISICNAYHAMRYVHGYVYNTGKKPAIDMGAMVVKEAVKRAGIEPSVVDEVIIGQVGEVAENGFVARAISLKAGMPKETTAYSVNRQCGSGLQSIVEAVMEIQTGQADVVVAGGAENISQLPYYVKDARWGARMGHKVFEDGVIDILTWPLDGNHYGVTAENVAEKYNVSREEQDQFALESHQKACKAIKDGKFKDEILPVELKDRKGNITIFDTDEGPREGQTLEKLAKLKPCFVKGGTVTAGNSSSLNDGAAAVVVMSKEKAEELGVVPKLKIEGFAVAGFDAELMGYSPKFSSEKLAKKLNLDLKKINMFEINEAFASQAYAVSRDLGLDKDKVNIYGGGISIGHPIGATGAVLTVKVMYELMRTDKKDAMISMCIGGGQGISMYFTKCN